MCLGVEDGPVVFVKADRKTERFISEMIADIGQVSR